MNEKLPKYLEKAKVQMGGGKYSNFKIQQKLKNFDDIDFEDALPSEEGEHDYQKY
ncbi:hypothetical protein [Chryseobacterium sp.]|uniref:hypothetical protein n=1 Tax=Chryseobacterium sp. TaxID=1871047 RepID=UPI00321C346F